MRKKRFVLSHFFDENLSRSQIAKLLKIGKSSVYRIYHDLHGYPLYSLPSPKKCGRRPHVFTPEEERRVVDVRIEFKANCNTLERVLASRGTPLAHNHIYHVLKGKDMIHKQTKKQRRNSWVRWERKHSLSLYQTDWKQLKNGGWLIVFKDDASRLIVASGVFKEATSEHSIEVLKIAIKTWGRPLAILTGRDTQFYASDKLGKPSAPNRFQQFLKVNDIKHILARVNHPQTCGKIERFFGEVENRLYKWHDFNTVDEVVHWYNYVLPNMSLDYDNLETPIQAFKRKMHHKKKIINEITEV